MIGFFGDSWIDTYGDTTYSWPSIVANLLNKKAGYYGKSGTSHWYAYQTFLKHYKKYDTIVFSHTTYTRWPSLPNSESLRHWDTTHLGNNKDSSMLMKLLKQNYMELCPDELLIFLCQHIYNDINKKCLEKNIHLVNVLPYSNPYENDRTEYVRVTNLNNVSTIEESNIDGKMRNTMQWISEKQIIDPRYCHLNFKNNKKLGHLIYDLIKNNVRNQRINLVDYEWEVFDEEMNRGTI